MPVFDLGPEADDLDDEAEPQVREPVRVPIWIPD
jgi:hypothetical protein